MDAPEINLLEPGPVHRRASRTSGSRGCARTTRCTTTRSRTAPGSGWSASTPTSSSATATRRRSPPTAPGAASWRSRRSRPPCSSEAAAAGGNLMLQMDPPDHTRYRKLVNRGFTPRMIGEMETHIRELTNGILDKALAARRGRLRRRRGRRAAARGDRRAHRRAARGPPQDLRVEQPHDRLGGPRVPGSATRRSSRRRSRCSCTRSSSPSSGGSQPGDDIITALLSAEVDGESLSDMDFNLFFLLLSVAGNETTRNAISHGMNAFLEHPDQWQLLPLGHRRAPGRRPPRRSCGGPRRSCTSGATSRATWSSAASRSRRATRSPSGTSPGNRDEDVFDDPFEFDIDPRPRTRTSRSAAAARTSASAPSSPAWRSTCSSRSWPGASTTSRRSGRPDRLRSNFIGGIKHLPVRYHPS